MKFFILSFLLPMALAAPLALTKRDCGDPTIPQFPVDPCICQPDLPQCSKSSPNPYPDPYGGGHGDGGWHHGGHDGGDGGWNHGGHGSGDGSWSHGDGGHESGHGHLYE